MGKGIKMCQNPSLSLTLTYYNYSSRSHLRPKTKTINSVHGVLKEERRNVNKEKEINPFMFIPLMLIAYWVISYNNSIRI